MNTRTANDIENDVTQKNKNNQSKPPLTKLSCNSNNNKNEKNNKLYKPPHLPPQQSTTVITVADVKTTTNQPHQNYNVNATNDSNYNYLYGSISVKLAIGSYDDNNDNNHHHHHKHNDDLEEQQYSHASYSSSNETTSLVQTSSRSNSIYSYNSSTDTSNCDIPYITSNTATTAATADIIELIPPTFIYATQSTTVSSLSSPSSRSDDKKMKDKFQEEKQSIEILIEEEIMPLGKRKIIYDTSLKKESEMVEILNRDHTTNNSDGYGADGFNQSESGNEEEKTNSNENNNYYFAKQSNHHPHDSSSSIANTTSEGSPSKHKKALPNLALDLLETTDIYNSKRINNRSKIYQSKSDKHINSNNTNDENDQNEMPSLLSKPFRSLSFNHKPSIANDINETNFEYQFFSTVDKIEDEFDRNSYEQLIPLNIRMELENRLFGWSHLYSEAIGHVLFPLLYYYVTFCFVSVVGLRYSDEACMSKEEDCQCGWFCTYQKVSFHGRNGDENQYEPIFGISTKLFILLRQIFSVWSAFNAFRTVRRRRRVWLRSTAAEYFKDEKRRDEIEEVDKTTLLGKISRKLRARKINKKLQKAGKRFEKRQKLRRNNFISSSSLSSYEGQHHRKVTILGAKQKDVREEWNEEIDNNYILSNNDDGITELSRNHSTTELDPNDFLEVYQKYKHVSQEDFQSIHSDEKHFYARTIPTFAMQSINMDQIRLKSKIQNVSYAHGGFFGAAPFMLANPHW